MTLDRSARPWIIFVLAATAAATGLYVWYHVDAQPQGVSGGSWPGLAFGSAGLALIVFALLLGLRKRFRTTRRLGRASVWMKGHVWLGLLSFPLILFHAGFKPNLWGGPVTQALMWAFMIVLVSGIVGVVIQNILPKMILTTVPMETMAEQHRRVLRRLRIEAYHLVESAATTLRSAAGPRAPEAAAGAAGNGAPAAAAVAVTDTMVAAAAVAARRGEDPGQRLRQFYAGYVRPYLATRPKRRLPMAREMRAEYLFENLRRMLPDAMSPVVDDLSSIVDERRQIARHRRLYGVLHGWLLIHVPLSYGMVILAVAHAVVALWYS